MRKYSVKSAMLLLAWSGLMTAVYAEPFEVYFSKPVCPSKASGEVANGASDLAALAAGFIDGSTSSIDICAYNISHTDVSDALIDAKDRGVEVRVIVEYDNRDSGAIDAIEAAGITVIDDTYGYNNGDGAMHNKFIVRDCRGDSDPENDHLWTGSYNFSYSGAEDNLENIVTMVSSDIAEAFTDEFNEMWGSTTMTPGYSSSRFGYRKLDDTAHLFDVGGVAVEVYMAPSDGSNEEIISEIDDSSAGVRFSIFSFTRDDVADAMESKYNGIPGYFVEGVFDSTGVSEYSEYWDMKGLPQGGDPWDPPADVYLARTQPDDALFHHKYMILDPGTGEARVLTGSHNWSTSARDRNDENLVIIHEPGIANLYEQEFFARFIEASGAAFPVYDIQYTEDLSGDSPFDDRVVRLGGIVTAVFDYAELLFVADSCGGAWSGIPLYQAPSGAERGDKIVVNGEVDEFFNLTEIKSIGPGDLEILSSGHHVPDAVVCPTGEVEAERYEGVLVEVRNVVVTDDDLGFGEWEVDDGSGPLRVDDVGDYSYDPVEGDTLDYLRGVVHYSFNNFKLEPRDNADFEELGIEEKESGSPAANPGSMLLPCFPNPCNPIVSIPLQLPAPSMVQLSIFDLGGRRVAQLVNRKLQEGAHVFEWRGNSDAGGAVSSGVYICSLEAAVEGDAAPDRETRKIMVLR